MSNEITVDIWSDIACPWCYIGKRNFEHGLAAFQLEQDVPVRVVFHSFELSPDNPVEIAESSAEYLAKHKGLQPAVVDRMLAQVTARAAEVGLSYDFDGVHNTNTGLAHQLLHFAKAEGRQAEMKERLMSAYFTEGRHVGHIDELVALAEEVGLDPLQARAALTSGQYADAVRADVQQAQAYGITGVPFFVIDGKYGLSGAQPAETFTQVLTEVGSERAAQ